MGTLKAIVEKPKVVPFCDLIGGELFTLEKGEHIFMKVKGSPDFSVYIWNGQIRNIDSGEKVICIPSGSKLEVT